MTECEDNECENGGTCQMLAGSITCTCPPHLTGVLCELSKHYHKCVHITLYCSRLQWIVVYCYIGRVTKHTADKHIYTYIHVYVVGYNYAWAWIVIALHIAASYSYITISCIYSSSTQICEWHNCCYSTHVCPYHYRSWWFWIHRL